MNEQLKNIFDNVNYWLSFAEAKNGSILALGVVWVQILSDITIFTRINCIVWHFSLFNCILAMLVSLFSFFPLMGKVNLIKKQEVSKDLNLIFYRDIASIESSDKYYHLFIDKYGCSKNEDSIDLAKDYMYEIYINSKIATNKYHMFQFSLFFQIVSVIAYFIFQFL